MTYIQQNWHYTEHAVLCTAFSLNDVLRAFSHVSICHQGILLSITFGHKGGFFFNLQEKKTFVMMKIHVLED